MTAPDAAEAGPVLKMLYVDIAAQVLEDRHPMVTQVTFVEDGTLHLMVLSPAEAMVFAARLTGAVVADKNVIFRDHDQASDAALTVALIMTYARDVTGGQFSWTVPPGWTLLAFPGVRLHSDDEARADRARTLVARRADRALGYAAVLTMKLAANRDGDMTAAAADVLAATPMLQVPAAGVEPGFTWRPADADVPEIVSRAMALAEGVTS